MSTAYLSIGSNLDDPREQIRRALHALRTNANTTLLKCSKIYVSQPWGTVSDQPLFLNAAVEILTKFTPAHLLTYLQSIEQAQNRVREQKWGPRTIDLDILLFDTLKQDTPELTIPHPFLCVREFVIYPLYDIAPDLCVSTPDNGMATIASLKAKINPRGIHEYNE